MAKEVTPEQIEMLDGMVAKARAAAEIIATYDQERVDRLCQAVAASVIDMKVWANLAAGLPASEERGRDRGDP